METKTKKIMKTLAIVLALASATATEGFAQTKAASGKVSSTAKVSNLSVQDLGSLRFKLAFENPLKQKTKVYLVDKDENILFSEYNYGNAQYVKAFNLSNLVDGEYSFVVQAGNEKAKKDFVISTKTLRGITLAKK